QLWYLQVVQRETYQDLADANRLRVVQVPSARGVIYDRTGELLVRNRPVYNVVIIPAFLPDDATAETRIFARLSQLLSLPITTQLEPTAGHNNGYFQAITHHQYNRQLSRQIVNPRSRQFVNAPLGIRDAVNQNRATAPFLPITIATDVDPITVSMIEEQRLDLPGVLIDIAPSRDYLHSELTSHILGYVGSIPAEQFDGYADEGYDLTDIVGLAGLEVEYESWLRGVKGLESIEVDVTGQKIKTVSQNIEARPGHNLRLTLDVGLQAATAQALQEQMDEVGSNQGVAIAMNPQNGEILAMVSLPSFDNNLFSQGISTRELSLLSEDRWTPLVNHATAGLYPPGSIFKIIPASGALQERVVSPETTFIDEGVLYLPNQFEPDNLDLAQPFFGWLRTGLGEVNVVSALAMSSNIYFYYVGGGYPPSQFEGLGLERLGRYAEMYGLGEPTGIDLPGELGGLVPNEKWKRLNYSEIWLTGDTYNMSVGQGFVLVTPLQMLNAYAAIANGGTLYRPHLVKEVLDADDNLVKEIEPEVIGRLDLDPANQVLIREGLSGVINWENGTAHDTFDVPGIDASGKTGTAEFCERYPQCLDGDGRVKTSHAWFVAYAPTPNPEIVTIVFVYGGDEGSQTSVPVASKILRHYFGIEDETEAPAATSDDDETEELPPLTFTGRLLGTDSWSRQGASISGYVLDAAGQGLAGVAVDVLIDGEPVAQVVSGAAGQFEYNELDPTQTQNWQFDLPGYPTTRLLQLQIAEGSRYLVEFKANPAAPVQPGALSDNQVEN
ncbi:MAG: penicillin-binding protein 2, partial [Anaerolineae bacterium]|nr:penicillin-binding protein 2 [Anaerolineae bacterium]